MTINARHRKHYKAGSVWKPGEQQAADEAAKTWVQRFLERFAPIRPKQA